MEMLRRQFGLGEPIRRGMELKIAREGEWRPAVLGGSGGVHREILEGRDCEIGWEDVFVGEFDRLVACFLGVWVGCANYCLQAMSFARCRISIRRWRRKCG